LSVPDGTVRDVHPNPWQRLARDWPAVDVHYAELGQVWGRTRWTRDGALIILNQRLTQVQRRVTIAHELEHLDRGAPCATLRASIEQRVLTDTARYLLPDIDAVAEAVAVYDLRRAANELWVTFPVLVDRLRALSAAQLAYVAQRRDAAA
jgi:uncharacterized protein DUF955